MEDEFNDFVEFLERLHFTLQTDQQADEPVATYSAYIGTYWFEGDWEGRGWWCGVAKWDATQLLSVPTCAQQLHSVWTILNVSRLQSTVFTLIPFIYTHAEHQNKASSFIQTLWFCCMCLCILCHTSSPRIFVSWTNTKSYKRSVWRTTRSYEHGYGLLSVTWTCLVPIFVFAAAHPALCRVIHCEWLTFLTVVHKADCF